MPVPFRFLFLTELCSDSGLPSQAQSDFNQRITTGGIKTWLETGPTVVTSFRSVSCHAVFGGAVSVRAGVRWQKKITKKRQQLESFRSTALTDFVHPTSSIPMSYIVRPSGATSQSMTASPDQQVEDLSLLKSKRAIIDIAGGRAVNEATVADGHPHSRNHPDLFFSTSPPGAENGGGHGLHWQSTD